ncbi:glutamine synthetase family protein [Brevibacterium linens]|uniref:glutamine synthetase family protein n=1 Tax=Brevibacterium linens TaxID=1703 RepID=UPI003BF59156
MSEDHFTAELPDDVHSVLLAIPDAAGILRGKVVPAAAWKNVAQSGIHMASLIYTWTPQCEARDEDEWNKPDKGWPDMHVVPDLSDVRPVPWRPGWAMVLCDTYTADGGPIPVSPRAALKRVLADAADAGYEVQTGFEIEFYLLESESKQPFHDDIRCYSISALGGYESITEPMRNRLLEFGIPIEAANLEYAPGQVEINLRYDEAQKTADNAVLFRNGVKEIAAQQGYLATFMAKISHDQSGSGVHLHHSLRKDGKNVFAADGKLSDVGRWYLGGLQKYMPELTLFGSPTPNSFKRRVPYSFCPTNATWGHDNRTVGLRVIEGSDSAVRIEQRDGSADANPYMIMAAQIAAGMRGIRDQIEPGPATDSDAYSDSQSEALPANVTEAADLLDKSEFAREIFGDLLVDVTLGIARNEENIFAFRVSEDERDRYLEVF